MLNVQNNFGQHTKCPLCKIEEDSQKHLLECVLIKLNSPDILHNTDSKYEDIFSNDIEKQDQISKLIETAIRKRRILLNPK